MDNNNLTIGQKLINYIASSQYAEKISKTKLAKILWYIDSEIFLINKKPLTDYKYKKYPRGPYTKDIDKDIAQLSNFGLIKINNKVLPIGYLVQSFISISNEQFIDLPKDQMDIIDNVIKYVAENHTAQSISDKTHDIIWESARNFEEIPVSAFLAKPSLEDINEEDAEWAEQAIEYYENREKAGNIKWITR
ncbi:MAG: Panacea domain-containing protein [bacterium]